jgi:hypothetical protein
MRLRLKALLREPLLHFVAIGAALFLWFEWSGSAAGAASQRITLSSGQIGHLAAGYGKTWQRQPTDAELKGLIDDWVREEIAVREAMAAGLDRDDTVIRRRLRQKFEFVAEDADAASPPTDAELGAWLARHADAFRVPPRVAFRQVFFSREKRREGTSADARRALARLQSAGAATRTEGVGDATMLPGEVDLVPLPEVERAFGSGFASDLGSIAPGQWAGPVESSFGLHLVLVRERSEGRLPDLAEVRAAVEREFLADRRKRQLTATYERLLAKYRVAIERPAAQPERAARKDGQ